MKFKLFFFLESLHEGSNGWQWTREEIEWGRQGVFRKRWVEGQKVEWDGVNPTHRRPRESKISREPPCMILQKAEIGGESSGRGGSIHPIYRTPRFASISSHCPAQDRSRHLPHRPDLSLHTVVLFENYFCELRLGLSSALLCSPATLMCVLDAGLLEVDSYSFWISWSKFPSLVETPLKMATALTFNGIQLGGKAGSTTPGLLKISQHGLGWRNPDTGLWPVARSFDASQLS